MAELALDREVQMYEKRLEPEIRRKVAESVVAAEISDRLNAFSNISWRGTAINFYLPVFISPTLIPRPSKCIPLFSSSPPKKTAPHPLQPPWFFPLCFCRENSTRIMPRWRDYWGGLVFSLEHYFSFSCYPHALILLLKFLFCRTLIYVEIFI